TIPTLRPREHHEAETVRRDERRKHLVGMRHRERRRVGIPLQDCHLTTDGGYSVLRGVMQDIVSGETNASNQPVALTATRRTLTSSDDWNFFPPSIARPRWR